LQGDELLIVNKLIYRVDQPDYGDIVVFHTDEQRDFIKRVIGLPGDQIAIKDGKVFRNGKPLEEPYIYEPMNFNMEEEVTVPEGHIYVLGDNRNNSKDSRRIGPVNIDAVVGRADLIIWPLDRMHFLTQQSKQ
jgi:signal peptidase I